MAMQPGREEWQRYRAVALPDHGETLETVVASGLLVGVDEDDKEEDYDKIMESVGNWSLRNGRGGM